MMSYVEAMFISMILSGCGWCLGWLFGDLQWQMRMYEANREDAKVYDEEDK